MVVGHLGEGRQDESVDLTQGGTLRADDLEVEPVGLAGLDVVDDNLDDVEQEGRGGCDSRLSGYVRWPEKENWTFTLIF